MVKDYSDSFPFLSSQGLKCLIVGNETENSLNAGTSLDEILQNVDDSIARIYDSLPENTAFIVVSGHGKVAEARRFEYFFFF